jgi:hypothetical protein
LQLVEALDREERNRAAALVDNDEGPRRKLLGSSLRVVAVPS